MKGSEKQITWAKKIIESRRPAVEKMKSILSRAIAGTDEQMFNRSDLNNMLDRLVADDSDLNEYASTVINDRHFPFGQRIVDIAIMRPRGRAGIFDEPKYDLPVAGADGIYDLTDHPALGWTSPEVGANGFAKISFAGEAFWLDHAEIADGNIVGTVANDLVSDLLQFGDRVRVPAGKPQPAPAKPVDCQYYGIDMLDDRAKWGALASLLDAE